uniref:hypothetical protein n=1 Tax=Catenulispora pinisilvae TaxID=2705253 RepID=UPI001890D4F3
MGTFNPVIPWRELERRLTWGRYGEAEQAAPAPEPAAVPHDQQPGPAVVGDALEAGPTYRRLRFPPELGQGPGTVT